MESRSKMKVAALYIYPVKSLRGISLATVRVRLRGFERDRRWMLVDEDGTFFTQRTHPQLAEFEVAIAHDRLEVSFANTGFISIPYFAAGRREHSVRVWDDKVKALEGPEPVNKWFSRYLEKKCRLVYMPDSTMRRLNPKYSETEDAVSFADGYPVLLTSQGSLDDLSSRMGEDLPMDLVISGASPWDEETWQRVRVGKATFRVVKPCPRCVVTTADQKTGERGKEPLATLATFRKKDGEVFFGMNLIPDALAEISVGDEVEVL